MAAPTVHISEGALVCDGAVFFGDDISIGSETVVFPGARITREEGAGPIVIGRGCVIEENASVVNSDPGVMRVGEGNLFEVGCTVRAREVGDFNVFQPKCEVGQEVVVPSGCCIGPTAKLYAAAALQSNTSVVRLGGQPFEHRNMKRPRNAEDNRAKVQSYRKALANQGKKYYLGKYHKLLPVTATKA